MDCFVKAAVDAGMVHYGFTPHSPIPIASPCNMKMSQVDEYLAEFNKLKDLYNGRINLYLSMEIDYLGDSWGASHPYFKSLPLDYRLSSIHFIPTPDGSEMIDVDGRPDSFLKKMQTYFNNDIRYVVDSFYTRTLNMIEAGGFDIIGHFDKIGFNASYYKPGIEQELWYKKHIENVIDAIRHTDIIVEVSTKAWNAPVGVSATDAQTYSPRLFPSKSTIDRMIKAGIPLVVNSDTHFPDRINSGRKAAFNMIDASII